MKRRCAVAEDGEDFVAARRHCHELETKMALLIGASDNRGCHPGNISVSTRDQAVTKLGDDVLERVAITIDVSDRQCAGRAHEADRREQIICVELCAIDIHDDCELTINRIREVARRDNLRFDVVLRQRLAPLLHDLVAFCQQCHAWRHHSSEYGSDEVYTPAS